MPANLESLGEEWRKLLTSLGAGRQEADRVFADLAEAHSRPGRFYHTLDHIAHVLATVHELLGQARNPAAVLLSVWCHDIVYNPRAKDNEGRSAGWAAHVLGQLGVDDAIIGQVRRLILLTQTHQAASDDLDAHILLDADLAILGAAPEEYDQYARAIRREYAWVPEAEYRAGRKAVLESFQKREWIYRTEKLHQRLEATARDNLRREGDSLG